MTEILWPDYTFAACKQCDNKCCGRIHEVGQAFVTGVEILKIVDSISKYPGEFLDFRTINGQRLGFIKAPQNTCMFFNKSTQMCEIYNVRPLNCRLFPLDIVKRGGNYLWLVAKKCFASHDSIENYLHQIEWNITSQVIDYANNPMSITDYRKYQILRII